MRKIWKTAPGTGAMLTEYYLENAQEMMNA